MAYYLKLYLIQSSFKCLKRFKYAILVLWCKFGGRKKNYLFKKTASKTIQKVTF